MKNEPLIIAAMNDRQSEPRMAARRGTSSQLRCMKSFSGKLLGRESSKCLMSPATRKRNAVTLGDTGRGKSGVTQRFWRFRQWIRRFPLYAFRLLRKLEHRNSCVSLGCCAVPENCFFGKQACFGLQPSVPALVDPTDSFRRYRADDDQHRKRR